MIFCMLLHISLFFFINKCNCSQLPPQTDVLFVYLLVTVMFSIWQSKVKDNKDERNGHFPNDAIHYHASNLTVKNEMNKVSTCE